ncbi:MAG: hypothetical protein AVDCRST_MAG21-751, partial [uncultured Nocardioidaceae bacterium]
GPRVRRTSQHHHRQDLPQRRDARPSTPLPAFHAAAHRVLRGCRCRGRLAALGARRRRHLPALHRRRLRQHRQPQGDLDDGDLHASSLRHSGYADRSARRLRERRV